MHTAPLLKSLFMIALLATSSCATQKSVPTRFETGKVTQVVINMNSRGIDHFTPFWMALWLAVVGSGIGSGATAHAIGAGGGALTGSGLGYLQENRKAKSVTRIVDVEGESGAFYRLQDKEKLPLRIGQRVMIAFDKHGRPNHLVTVPTL